MFVYFCSFLSHDYKSYFKFYFVIFNWQLLIPNIYKNWTLRNILSKQLFKTSTLKMPINFNLCYILENGVWPRARITSLLDNPFRVVGHHFQNNMSIKNLHIKISFDCSECGFIALPQDIRYNLYYIDTRCPSLLSQSIYLLFWCLNPAPFFGD